MRDDASIRGIARIDQRVGTSDEVCEGVGLLLALAVEVPAPALLRAAPDMRDGVDEAAVDEAQEVGAEPRRHQRAVGAVTIEQQRRVPVEGQSSPMEERDRHPLPIRRRSEQPTGHVVGRVVPARHALALAQGAVAAAAIIVPGQGRRRHGGIDEPDRRGVEFMARLEAQRVGVLGEGDSMLVARVEIAHDDARLGVLDLHPDQVPGEEVEVADHHASPVRNEVRPGVASGRVERSGHHLEVLGSVRVGADEQALAPVLNGIDQQGFARLHHAQTRAGLVPVEEMDLRGLVIAGGHRQEGPRLRLRDVYEETGIGLVVDRLVGRLRRAEAVAQDLGRPVAGVQRHVPETRAVAGPDRLAGGRLDGVVEVEAGGEVAHADRVEFGALGIDAPGHPRVVVRVADPAPHLAHQRLPQCRDLRERRLREAVLGPEVGCDVVGEHGRVVEDGLPILRLDPCIVVDELPAVDPETGRPCLGDRSARPVSEQAPRHLSHGLSHAMPPRPAREHVSRSEPRGKRGRRERPECRALQR